MESTVSYSELLLMMSDDIGADNDVLTHPFDARCCYIDLMICIFLYSSLHESDVRPELLYIYFIEYAPSSIKTYKYKNYSRGLGSRLAS